MLRRSSNNGKTWFRVSVGKLRFARRSEKDRGDSAHERELSQGVCGNQVIRPNMRMNIREAIEKLVNRVDLSEAETIDVMNQIMTGEASPLQVAAFSHRPAHERGKRRGNHRSGARHARKSAPGERRREDGARYLRHRRRSERHFQYFNDHGVCRWLAPASTVAKHGNRSVSSQSGSADVLGALGVKVDAPKERVEQCIAKIGIGFFFAPLLHEAMKYAVQPRRDIGIRTIFNILGPLTNPAMASHQLIGIYSGEMVGMIAQVLKNLGSARAMVVHGLEGLDEISLCGPTEVAELRDGAVKEYAVEPEQYRASSGAAWKNCTAAAREQSALIVQRVLDGNKLDRRGSGLA